MSSVNLKRKKQTNAQMSEVMDEFDRFEYFFATHWKKVVLVAVLAVIAVAVYCASSYFIKKSNTDSAIAFTKAASIEEFEAAMAKHSDAPGWVYLKLGTLYMEKGNLDKAAENFKQAAADTTLPEIQWRAVLNLATLDESKGQYEAAALAFADFARSRREPGSIGFALEAYCAAARNYIAVKQNDQALTLIGEAEKLLSEQTAPDQQQLWVGHKLMLKALRSDATAPAAPAK